MGNLINHLDARELFWAEVGGATVFLPRGSRLTRLNEASRRLGEETHLDCQSFQLFSLPIFLPCVATSLFLCLFFRHWRDVGRHQLTATVALLTLTGHPTEPLSPPLSPTPFPTSFSYMFWWSQNAQRQIHLIEAFFDIWDNNLILPAGISARVLNHATLAPSGTLLGVVNRGSPFACERGLIYVRCHSDMCAVFSHFHKHGVLDSSELQLVSVLTIVPRKTMPLI